LKIAQLCAARGHDVTIFTRTWQGERPENVRIELFGRHGWSNISRNRAWLKQLVRTLSERETRWCDRFQQIARTRYLLRLRSLLRPRRFNGSNHFGIAGCRAIATSVRWRNRCSRAAKPAHVLVLTEQEIPRYEKFYGTERERFHVLPPGIERGHSRRSRNKKRARVCAANETVARGTTPVWSSAPASA